MIFLSIVLYLSLFINRIDLIDAHVHAYQILGWCLGFK